MTKLSFTPVQETLHCTLAGATGSSQCQSNKEYNKTLAQKRRLLKRNEKTLSGGESCLPKEF